MHFSHTPHKTTQLSYKWPFQGSVLMPFLGSVAEKEQLKHEHSLIKQKPGNQYLLTNVSGPPLTKTLYLATWIRER